MARTTITDIYKNCKKMARSTITDTLLHNQFMFLKVVLPCTNLLVINWNLWTTGIIRIAADQNSQIYSNFACDCSYIPTRSAMKRVRRPQVGEAEWQVWRSHGCLMTPAKAVDKRRTSTCGRSHPVEERNKNTNITPAPHHTRHFGGTRTFRISQMPVFALMKLPKSCFLQRFYEYFIFKSLV